MENRLWKTTYNISFDDSCTKEEVAEYKDYEFVYNKDESTYMAEVERKIMTVSYSQNNQ